MLSYTMRIRDLVHGFVTLTDIETQVMDHTLFQRLRHIRQNDVAFLVYPSINISRFEHSIGACHVVGRMAEQLTRSPRWKEYLRHLKKDCKIVSAEEFVQLVRLYALLHDVGHLPLSHLFEKAVEDYGDMISVPPLQLVHEWFGQPGFKKLHEAFGALIINQIVKNVHIEESIREALIILMTKKEEHLPPQSPLAAIKKLVDSEIDGDRIDSTARDGFLAGREYGNYDIERLCSSVFLDRNETGWRIVYSDKAISSMEALLLDRYRTHTWIHFNRRVIVTKLLVRSMLSKLLMEKKITKDDFQDDLDKMTLRDDVWLWNMLRESRMPDDPLFEMARRAVLYREKYNTLNLWKDRVQFYDMEDNLEKATGRRSRNIDYKKLCTKEYEKYLLEEVGVTGLVFHVGFEPVSKEAVPLYSEEKKQPSGQYLHNVSEIVDQLNAIWAEEPQYYVVFIGDIGDRVELKEEWLNVTAQYVKKKL